MVSVPNARLGSVLVSVCEYSVPCGTVRNDSEDKIGKDICGACAEAAIASLGKSPAQGLSPNSQSAVRGTCHDSGNGFVPVLLFWE